MKRNTIANYEIGRNEPIDAVISLICKEFNVNEEWLRSGTGEMFKQHPLSDEVGYYVEDLLEYDGEGNPFYDMIIEMMKKYHELDAKSKVVIREYFKSIAKSMKKEAEED
uniref:CI repressor n=1 Tax=Siphoviridae sp. ctWDo30 TaxID=2826360 RepID=A0A8S5N5Y8_9CAUD|nr:MAG TPA: CI repressor [Siphoviridae sp. ctWDo30]